jgi:hypothetical protein
MDRGFRHGVDGDEPGADATVGSGAWIAVVDLPTAPGGGELGVVSQTGEGPQQIPDAVGEQREFVIGGEGAQLDEGKRSSVEVELAGDIPEVRNRAATRDLECRLSSNRQRPTAPLRSTRH